MEIVRAGIETRRGPSEWFTGDVWFDELGAAPEPSRIQALSVHFAPGARTAWHSHPRGQILRVVEGVGRVQRRGEPVEEIRPGDSVLIEAGEEHWHGAGPSTFMTHVALQELDDEGASAHWGEQVTDEEYGAGG